MKLILVTGVGRSGTSLLQSMLHKHSQVNFPPETHFFKRHMLPFLLRQKLPSHNDLARDPYLQRLNQSTRADIIGSTFVDLNDLIIAFSKITRREGCSFSGDKDTEYVRYLPHLNKIFPEAYVIHIIRDPRDVVLSRTKTAWGKKHGLSFHAAEYQYYFKKVIYQGPMLFKKRYLELKYEELINEPVRSLNRLLPLIGLKYESEMLNFYQTEGSLIGTDEKEWKNNLGKPLIRGNQDKYRLEMSGEDIALIEYGIRDLMEKYGYVIGKLKPTLIRRLVKKVILTLFAVKTYRERIR